MAWPRNSTEVTDDQWRRWQDEHGHSDRAAGFEITRDFRPFDQMNDIFTRAFWDERVASEDAEGFFASYRIDAAPRRGEGFSQRDFALRNAAWALSDMISERAADQGKREGFQAPIAAQRPIAGTRVELQSPEVEAAQIKKIARLFGADLVGITPIDTRWHYTHRPDVRTMTPVPNDLPEGLTHVIVMGHEMRFDLVETYPSALAGAATGQGYSNEAQVGLQLAAYIRNLGYEAVASMNDTALVIPYAIKAGLGEYGRNQTVLTPEFGPRLRFSKVFTNLPLAIDGPRALGFRAYCDICTKCADACPPKALPKGPPTLGGDSPSTIGGVRKWSANCEACFGYWTKIKTDCAICVRVCPFNRPQTWHHRLWRRLALGRGRRLALWWENRRGKRPRLKPGQWWDGQRKT